MAIFALVYHLLLDRAITNVMITAADMRAAPIDHPFSE
jgi:hypothetical protein